jgi:uncharacterized protein YndB with AHSA1/START domain
VTDPNVIHHAIDVDATPEQAWRVFTDLTTWPRWFPNAVSARALRPDPFRPGGAIEVSLSVPVVGSLTLRLDVEEADPPRLVRWVGKAWGVRGDHRYTFEDRGKWTRVTSHERFGGPLSTLANRLAPGRIDDMAHETIARLKQVIEAELRENQ